MQRGVAQARGKARPHRQPGHRGAIHRAGLQLFPPLGARRSFSVEAPARNKFPQSPSPVMLVLHVTNLTIRYMEIICVAKVNMSFI